MEDNDPPLSDVLASPFLNLLLTLRAVCGGDLELNIIILAIIDRTIGHPEFRALGHAERVSDEDPVFTSLGVNVRGIADSTGIPRETVRRKVRSLIDIGWIAQVDGHLHFTARGYRDLAPARLGLEDLAIRFHALVEERKRRLGR